MILQGNPEAVAAVSLSENLLRQLRMDILQGKLKAGEKLTEQRVCSEYSVSRTPVREAFQKLEIDGLIETVPNRGAFVVGFTQQDISDMYDLRKAYEVQAVQWAIERMSNEEFEEIEETFEFMEFYTNKNDVEKMYNINTNFHNLIYTASRNKMLMHFLSSYQLYIKYSRKTAAADKDYLAAVLDEHRAIYEAIKNRDVEAGAKAMTIHMDNSKARAGM